MGNQESTNNEQTLPVSPVIRKLRNTLHLTILSNKTSSFVNQNFTSQIKKTSGIISRTNNPFCPLGSVDSKDEKQNWLNCCLISPIMAIASPRIICDQKGKYCQNVKILGVTKKQGYIQVPVKDVILIKQNSICLLLLSKPIIDLGWAGLTFLNSKEEIQNEAYRIINHPKSQIDFESGVLTYHQQITKAFYKIEKEFVGSYKSMAGSLLFKIIDKKPYIVGIQINERQAQFITKEILTRINQAATKLINLKRQKQILSLIDIQKLQLMEKL